MFLWQNISTSPTKQTNGSYGSQFFAQLIKKNMFDFESKPNNPKETSFEINKQSLKQL